MSIYSAQPGKYRHRVEIQHQVRTRDPVDGAVIVAWQTFVLPSGTPCNGVPAEVLTGPGRELIAANAQQAETTARIAMRWFPDLTAAMRILWDGRVYNIKSLETDSTGRREWRLPCTDGVNDGR